MVRKPKNIPEIETSALPLPVAEPTPVKPFEVEYRSRCGGALQSAREKSGLTVHAVAAQLRLSTKQIEALEADRFNELPEHTIVKGFIRNYAKLLKVSPQPMLDAYSTIVPDAAPQSFTLQPSATMPVSPYHKPNVVRYAAMAAFLIGAILIWLFYQSYVQKPSPVQPHADIMQPQPDGLPEAAMPVGERAAYDSSGSHDAQTSSGVDVGVPTATPTTTTPSTTAQPVVSSVASAVPAAVPMQTTLTELSASDVGNTRLEFNATQETWINVVGANGEEVYSKILFAGNRELIVAETPLNVTVGNALGTTLSVNGKVVDLAPHTRVNVAHIKVEN